MSRSSGHSAHRVVAVRMDPRLTDVAHAFELRDHPNVGGVILMDLGCEEKRILPLLSVTVQAREILQ